MAHFHLESAISDATRMDAPMQRGPMMRWQRKALESGVRALSIDGGLNASGLSGPRTFGSAKTPKMTPHTPGLASLSPSRLANAKTPNKSGKTPNKNGKTPTSKSAPNTPHRGQDLDRFIPNRAAMDTEKSHFALVTSENLDPNHDQEQDPAKVEYVRKMTEALNNGEVPADAKILKFKQRAPEAKEGHMNNLKVLYSSGAASSHHKHAAVSRQIPQQPERILDAPELMDDYYLNLMDWSSNNHLSIALGTAVYIWDASSGGITQLLELEGADDYVSSVSWIREGNILAVGNSTGAVQLWDVASQKLVRTMTGHAARVGALSWNSYIVTSGSRSGAIHHHDVRVPTHHVGTLTTHTQEVCGLQWAPDGRLLASGANDNLVAVWDAALSHDTTRPLLALNQHQAAIKALSWCPWQGSVLASGGGTADRHIRLWNTNTGACLNAIDTSSQVCSILWSSHYKELISGHGFAQFQLTLWKYPSMTRTAELHGHTARILSLAMSPDGTTVASAAADETLRLWKCFEVDKQKKGAGRAGRDKGVAIPMSKGIR